MSFQSEQSSLEIETPRLSFLEESVESPIGVATETSQSSPIESSSPADTSPRQRSSEEDEDSGSPPTLSGEKRNVFRIVDLYKVTDPGLDEVLNVPDKGQEPVFDPIFKVLYADACKVLKIVPCSPCVKGLGNEYMNLKYYGVKGLGLQAISEALLNSTQVLHLDLHDNFLDYYGVRSLAKMLSDNTFISELNLQGCRTGDNGAFFLGDTLIANSAITSLDLSRNDLQDDDGNWLATALNYNRAIRILNLSSNHLGDNAAELIGAALEENHVLQSLDMSWNDIGTPGMRKFLKSCAESLSLQRLNLSGLTMDLPVAAALGRLLDGNNRLTHLNVSHCFTDYECTKKYWGKAVEKNEALTELLVGPNLVDPAGAVVLLRSAYKQAHHTLTLLDLSKIDVNKEFLRVIRTNKNQHPKLKILYGRVSNNYIIKGANPKHLLFKRANYEAEMASKDVGEFLFNLEGVIPKADFIEKLTEAKMKLSETLVAAICKEFLVPIGKVERIEIDQLKEEFFKFYPEKEEQLLMERERKLKEAAAKASDKKTKSSDKKRSSKGSNKSKKSNKSTKSKTSKKKN